MLFELYMKEFWSIIKRFMFATLTLKKAFDRVNWCKLMTMLQSMGVDWRDRKLLWNLHNGHKAYVRIGEEQSGACSIGRGVR